MNIFQFISNKFERDEKILIMIVISSLFIIFVVAMVGEQSELQKKQQGEEMANSSEMVPDELTRTDSITETPEIVSVREKERCQEPFYE